ncbi:MAG: hypothetical protein KC468_21435, partial [Myxococcales bacterium]|nr:hypothetical protein [Myxococcales bacterium]
APRTLSTRTLSAVLCAATALSSATALAAAPDLPGRIYAQSLSLNCWGALDGTWTELEDDGVSESLCWKRDTAPGEDEEVLFKAYGGWHVAKNADCSVTFGMSIALLATAYTDDPAADIAGFKPGTAPLPCSAEPELASVGVSVPTNFIFRNVSDAPRVLYWLNPQGERVEMLTLAPGEGTWYSTDQSHPWVIGEQDGTCVEVFVPTEPGLPAYLR